jgi:hypothetical protein
MLTERRRQEGFSLVGIADSKRWAVCGGFLVFCLWFFHYLYPYLHRPLMEAGDLSLHVRFVQSAKEAMGEGQFPIMFANDASLRLQPVYLYYTPVFYTVAGSLAWLGLNAYDALLVGLAVFVVCLQAGLWLLLRELGCNRLVAATGFGWVVTAPYFVTCLYARTAIAELSFLCLLPIAVHAVLVHSRREGFAPWLYLVLSTGLLVASHKIFAGWLMIILGLVHAATAGLKPRRKLFLYLAAMAGGMLLVSPYWFNAWWNARNLDIAQRGMEGYLQRVGVLHDTTYDGPANRLGILWSLLTSNWDVFLLYPRVNPLSTTPHLYLQVGQTVSLAGLLAVWLGWRHRLIWVIGAFVASFVILACSFWELFPFWRYMPEPLRVIQFPYRILSFVLLSGGILVAVVTNQLLRLKRYAAVVVVAGVAIWQLTVFDWRPALSTYRATEAADADFLQKDFWEPAAATAPQGPVQASETFGKVETSKNCLMFTFKVPSPGVWLALPVLCSRNLSILVDGKPATRYQLDQRLVLEVPKGSRHIHVERQEPVSISIALVAWFVLLIAIYVGVFRHDVSKAST